MLNTLILKCFCLIQIFLILCASVASYSKPKKEIPYVIYDDSEEPTYIRNINHPLFREFNNLIRSTLTDYIEYEKIEKIQKAYQYFYINYEDVKCLLGKVEDIKKENDNEIKTGTINELESFIDDLIIGYEGKFALNKSTNLINYYKETIFSIAKQFKIPIKFFEHLVKTESSYRPYVVSKDGAIGLTQFMFFMMKHVIDDTKININIEEAYKIAKDENGNNIYYKENPALIKGEGLIWEPEINILIGAIILRDNYDKIKEKNIYSSIKSIFVNVTQDIEWRLALIVYNAGLPKFLEKLKKFKKSKEKIPFQVFLQSFCEETENYFCGLK